MRKLPSKRSQNDASSTTLTEGKQICLRPVQLSDATERYVSWMNDPDVNQFLESRFSTTTREALGNYIRQMQDHPDNAFDAFRFYGRRLHGEDECARL